MNVRSLFTLVLAVSAFAAVAAPSTPVRRVLIEPVQVTFDKEWLVRMNASRGPAHAVREEDARRIAADFAASLEHALGDAVRARGFEIAASPSPDVLRLSARIDDLYVNAPDVRSSAATKTFVREAGRATLRAQGRDADGSVRLQSEVRGTAGDTGRLSRASDVTNQFWFDALFRGWAREVAAELGERATR